MTQNTENLQDKPQPPGDGECCESGVCDPCVWDFYYKKLQQWRIQQSERQATESS
ncbi:hypothetical protein FE810_01970 [Thalassotalea litorea]|uniref:Oxidoreductase-like domain-containing protein n=1 Tax=Thalassotalea litorea TaxID=2020715 RepID=A0A5R9ISQ1_9GAMM|nr:oxidoreductase-like domain-containing protein [Thalassotalea litorea]TLU67077.1 hypothetical protein FE810_01970 [Thalassotalea litorea]